MCFGHQPKQNKEKIYTNLIISDAYIGEIADDKLFLICFHGFVTKKRTKKKSRFSQWLLIAIQHLGLVSFKS